MDLMHVGVCTLLEPLGHYVHEGIGPLKVNALTAPQTTSLSEALAKGSDVTLRVDRPEDCPHYLAVHQSGTQVPRHTPVPHGVVSVGRQSNVNDVIPFQANEFCKRLPNGCVGLEDHDAIVARIESEFILGANHAQGNLTTDFPFFDFERISAFGVKHGAYCGRGSA